MGAPAYVSFPHYAHADASLLDTVEGLEPDEDKHSFTLDIIPVSVGEEEEEEIVL